MENDEPPKSLGAARARRATDAKDVSPADLFEDLIERMRSGQLKVTAAVVVLSLGEGDDQELAVDAAGVEELRDVIYFLQQALMVKSLQALGCAELVDVKV